MTSKAQLELTAIAEQAGDELQIHYVSLSSLADKFLKGNSKLHSMSDLSASIARYDFQDAMKFDSSLNGGDGGIVAGNGRLEWLLWAKESGQVAPRGIKAKDGEWFVPVVFGVEFKDENEAVAFSISHNLSPMWGSDLTFLDQTRLFDEDLLNTQLVGLAEMDLLPVGLDGNDLDLWLGLNDKPTEDQWNDALDNLPDGDKAPFQQMTFTLHNDQAVTVKEAMDIAKTLGAFDGLNENGNGNAISRVCELFLTYHASNS
jgi:hypothetical protein